MDELGRAEAAGRFAVHVLAEAVDDLLAGLGCGSLEYSDLVEAVTLALSYAKDAEKRMADDSWDHVQLDDGWKQPRRLMWLMKLPLNPHTHRRTA